MSQPVESSAALQDEQHLTFESFILAEGLLSSRQLQELSQEARLSNQSLLSLLRNRQVVADEPLSQAVANYCQVPYLLPESVILSSELLKLLPATFIQRHQVLPVKVDEAAKRLDVVLPDPAKLTVLDEISLLTGFRAIPHVTSEGHLSKLLLSLRDTTHTRADEALQKAKQKYSTESRQDLSTASLQAAASDTHVDEAPIVQLVEALMQDACYKGASDVHIESHAHGLIVRFRIDGILRDIRNIPENIAPAVISRIKVASGMDIAERRRPQDGRMSVRLDKQLDKQHGGQTVDCRVNTMAVRHGESVVIRLLRSNSTAVGLEKLGLEFENHRRLMRMITEPNGIILVTGPTGSGKTTTLYACLRELNSRERKIITIEDPIEYPLTGINQTQISYKAGLDFPTSLRAIMRQDPDVIMVGEIRDKETLDSAMHAALTGHLVFSTLHTNSAAATVTRLREMGAPAYMISSTINGIIAQRLVRKVCEHCKQPYQANEDELTALGFPSSAKSITLYKGIGCEHCEQSGYQGRLGLYEMLSLSQDIQELVTADALAHRIEQAAIEEGMVTLGMNGERMVASGMTTVEEVIRVLGPDW